MTLPPHLQAEFDFFVTPERVWVLALVVSDHQRPQLVDVAEPPPYERAEKFLDDLFREGWVVQPPRYPGKGMGIVAVRADMVLPEPQVEFQPPVRVEDMTVGVAYTGRFEDKMRVLRRPDGGWGRGDKSPLPSGMAVYSDWTCTRCVYPCFAVGDVV